MTGIQESVPKSGELKLLWEVVGGCKFKVTRAVQFDIKLIKAWLNKRGLLVEEIHWTKLLDYHQCIHIYVCIIYL